MHRSFRYLWLALLLTGCANEAPPGGRQEHTDRLELPEPDRQERLNYEAKERVRQSGCAFTDPDTSLSGIRLNDSKSTVAVIGRGNRSDNQEQYRFYSSNHAQVMTLTHHPGDRENSMSVFGVAYAGKNDSSYKQLPLQAFRTEKGICLGVNKLRIVERLGSCYSALDSSKNYVELYYRIANPDDSKTKLLARHNMPVYYASYRLRNDRLEQFEFGFEYP